MTKPPLVRIVRPAQPESLAKSRLRGGRVFIDGTEIGWVKEVSYRLLVNDISTVTLTLVARLVEEEE